MKSGIFAKLAAVSLSIGLLLTNSAISQENSGESAQVAEEGEELSLALPEFVAIEEEIARRLAGANSQAMKTRLAGMEAHYALNGFKPIWLENGAAADKARQMVEILDTAEVDGLRPEDYDVETLREKLAARGEAATADLEVHLSIAAVTYAQHMNAGRLDPSQVNREIVIYPDRISAEAVLGNLRKTTSLKAYLRLLAPHTPRYERLRTALAGYRRIEENGGWTKVPEGEVIKPGDSDERIPLIRQRMMEAGLYETANAEVPVPGVPETSAEEIEAPEANDGAQAADGGAPGGDGDTPETDPALVYDDALKAAVEEFQERTGQTRDGIIGPATIAAMNVPVSDRITTMIVNMERNRWMQNDFGRVHILANLADQVVKLVKDGENQFIEVIQVGAPYHRTPVFSDEMEYLEFNPYWNVPRSIAVNEYLPKLRRNPGVLAAENIELLMDGRSIQAGAVAWDRVGTDNFPFRLRQRPGPGNALGRVKFMFPNRFNVYLHDTPSKSKFAATQRYFSHGCLRVRDPFRFAEVLLRSQGWTRDRVDAVIASGERTVVKLDQKIPVHVVYITSFVNKDGSVHFREDVYGRDKILAEALAALDRA